MRLPAGLVAAFLIAGCGGGGGGPAHRVVPVGDQLRDAIQQALHQPNLGSVQHTNLPLGGDVVRCTGPHAGPAGTYVCTLTPSQPALSVRVDGTGKWSVTLPRRGGAATSLWGFGLRLP